jgi:mono/diheme cytochrome c family protein
MKTLFQIVAFFLWLAAVGFAQEGAPVDFARQILPILSDKCFVCHGPDAKDEDLVRLDSFAGATADLGDYQAIDHLHPEKSELVARIDSVDDPMPPVDFDKKLTEQERALLRRWVNSGGQYSKHWAFVAPVKAKDVKLETNSNPIDYWVGSQLKAKGIDFAPAASRPILARRAALVLTGLPPEQKLLDAFLADKMSRHTRGLSMSYLLTLDLVSIRHVTGSMPFVMGIPMVCTWTTEEEFIPTETGLSKLSMTTFPTMISLPGNWQVTCCRNQR